jgi:hypothetical protein
MVQGIFGGDFDYSENFHERAFSARSMSPRGFSSRKILSAGPLRSCLLNGSLRSTFRETFQHYSAGGVPLPVASKSCPDFGNSYPVEAFSPTSLFSHLGNGKQGA